MTKETSFSKNLTTWYRKNARNLPWRETTDPYKIWVSEVMLQQTTVNAVIPYYNRWIETFPDVEDVACAPLPKILKMWQGLGYYARAKNIQRAAQMMVEKYQSRVPANEPDLKSLPGFGPYTRGAVLSIAFDQRVPIIDANVRRVIMRMLALEGKADTKADPAILEYLDTVMPKKNLRTFNQALMELGAMVCRNREPLCSLCPVRPWCRAFQKGVQELIPSPVKKVLKNLDVVVGILQREGKYFIQKRPANGLLADLWEFPGGKIEAGETAEEALSREFKEELNIEVKSSRPLMRLKHFYTQFRVDLYVRQCLPYQYPKTDETHKWVSLSQFKTFPMPSGSAKIVEKLKEIGTLI